MPTGFEASFFRAESVLLAGGVVVAILVYVLHRLRRSRPELRIGRAVVIGVVLRVLAAAVLGALAPGVRGTDETTFLHAAAALRDGPLTGADSLHALTSTFHVWLFSLQLRIPDFPEFAMRIFQVGFSILGLVLLLGAVHDLAGPQAARIAAWATMLEPSSIFFSSFLHKEPFMLLGAGLVAFGGGKLWQRRDLGGLGVMAVGAGIATVARPYAGAMLFVAVGAVGLHGSLSRRGPVQRRSLVGLTIVVVLLAAATPAALDQISNDRLQEKLQTSQDVNASDQSNLKLNRVDFSTRTQIIQNLPNRMLDVALRPYPWELGSVNQRLGLPGTLAAIIVLALLLNELVRAGGAVFRRVGPILYPAIFLFLAFSLAAGNAGTAFRLRSTVVALAIGVIVVLRERRVQEQARERLLPEALGRSVGHGPGPRSPRRTVHI